MQFRKLEYDGCQNELDILKIKIGNGESL